MGKIDIKKLSRKQQFIALGLAAAVLVLAVVAIVGNSPTSRINRGTKSAARGEYEKALQQVEGLTGNEAYALRQFIRTRRFIEDMRSIEAPEDITPYTTAADHYQTLLDELNVLWDEVYAQRAYLDGELYDKLLAMEEAVSAYHQDLSTIQDFERQLTTAVSIIIELESVEAGEYFRISHMQARVEESQEALDAAADLYLTFEERFDPHMTEVPSLDAWLTGSVISRLEEAWDDLLIYLADAKGQGYDENEQICLKSGGDFHLGWFVKDKYSGLYTFVNHYTDFYSEDDLENAVTLTEAVVQIYVTQLQTAAFHHLCEELANC